MGHSLSSPSWGRQAADTARSSFWASLSMIAWCPVLADAPVPGLPWAPGGGRIAAPRAVRPAADMVLVSACMRVLDGECRCADLKSVWVVLGVACGA
jgi:hypothetical protein